ncbi:MAG: hypothetical protein KatS3mg114_1125 [Planctomycetaceae bacterium]|nr:MAG: hypothetical protein KatS3mg114_1125 [Planctomycetaceae bacterium]
MKFKNLFDCLLWYAVLGLGCDGLAQEAGVMAVQAPGLVGLRIQGEPFLTFNHSPGLAKPYFHPLRAPGGHVVTSLAPFDHKHHKGIWIGVEHVNGWNFWGGKYQQQDVVDGQPAAERIHNEQVEVHPLPHGAQQLAIVNIWQGKEGRPVIREETRVNAYPDRLLIFEIHLRAMEPEVRFDDTKEGFFAVRVAPTMIGRLEGRIVNAEGLVGEKDCWGKPSAWVDYSGPVDGKLVGIALFDHPANFRPSRYHVRDYGLFAISPFGEKVYSKGAAEAAPITLKQGEALRLVYGLFTHQGDEKGGKVAETYQRFLERSAGLKSLE